MKSFKEWLLDEMAFTSKMPILMDEEDIKFLQQIPSPFWMQALEARYSELLLKAVGQDGNLKPNWRDRRVMTFKRNSRPLPSFEVDTGISKLVEKLKGLRYEINNPDPDSVTALFYSPMTRGKAHQIVNLARQFPKGPEREFIMTDGRKWRASNHLPTPSFAKFIPNRFEHIRNDYDTHEKHLEIAKWQPMKHQVEEEAKDVLERSLQILGQNAGKINGPHHRHHINWYHWNKPTNKRKLLETAIEKIRLNLKDPRTETRSGRAQIFRSYFDSEFQRGIIGRAGIEKLHGQNKNVNSMLYRTNPETGENYTPDELATLAPTIRNYVSILDRRKAAKKISNPIITFQNNNPHRRNFDFDKYGKDMSWGTGE